MKSVIDDALASLNSREEFSIKRAVLATSDGTKYIEFIRTLKPNYFVVWRDITLGHCALWLSWLSLILVQSLSSNNWLVGTICIPLGAVLIGLAINYVNFFLHEAAHYNISGSRETNDLLSNLFIGSFANADVGDYRLIHFDHHRHLGTDRDTEPAYQSALTARYLFESFFGIKAFRTILERRRRLQTVSKHQSSERSWVTPSFIALNGSAVLFPFLTGHWWASVSWTIGLVGFFPLSCAVRQLLEHRPVEPLSAHAGTTRIFQPGLFCTIFGGAGFDRHFLHHLEPQVSYTRLKELEQFLLDTPLKGLIQERYSTYLSAFVRLYERE